jgi:hypothetical protein
MRKERTAEGRSGEACEESVCGQAVAAARLREVVALLACRDAAGKRVKAM